MNKTIVIGGTAGADARHSELRGLPGFASSLAAIFVIALGVSAWQIVSTGESKASAAVADAQATPRVPYFPSLYVNRATEIEPQPPTF
jgi:hypothetical protein